MKKLRGFLSTHWRLASGGAVGFVALLCLLLYRLGSLSGGLSNTELHNQIFASSWHHLAHDVLNLPLTLVQWLILSVFSHHGSTVTRLPSAFFGGLSVLAVIYILRRWYGLRTAIFGSLLYASSSWFLHVSRFGGNEVLYLWAVPSLLALHIAWDRHAKLPQTTFLALAGQAALLYVPGMIWLVILSAGLQPHHFTAGWRSLRHRWQQILAPVMFILLLVPLFITIYHTPSLGQTWLGLPSSFSNPGEIPRRLAQSLSFLVWRGPSNPDLWLDRLPILDVFGILMALLGALFYARHWSAPRTRLLAGTFIVGALFYALGGPVGFSVVVPVVYLVIAAGVGYLLHEWLRVFPRNPLARATGYTLLGLAIVFSCTYNLRAYFVAWPHNSATVAAFHNHR